MNEAQRILPDVDRYGGADPHARMAVDGLRGGHCLSFPDSAACFRQPAESYTRAPERR